MCNRQTDGPTDGRTDRQKDNPDIPSGRDAERISNASQLQLELNGKMEELRDGPTKASRVIFEPSPGGPYLQPVAATLERREKGSIFDC